MNDLLKAQTFFPELVEQAQWRALLAANERLATARSMDGIVDIVRTTARFITGAEGIAIVLRDTDQCFYVAEDAISPLWTGSRFPAEHCVSGWAMRHHQSVTIPNVFADERVPKEAYAATFVRSMAMVPIGRPDPIAAVGAYWATFGPVSEGALDRLEALARSAALAIENNRLLAAVEESDRMQRLAFKAGRLGTWNLDVVTKALFTSDICRENFGRDSDDDFTYKQFEEMLHPEDRPRILDAIRDAVKTGADYDCEYRVITSQGDIRWVGIRGQPTYDAAGKIIALSGVSADVTERKQLEGELRILADTLERRVEQRTAELDKVQQALRQSQKLEAMGQLTGGVAHDFNNLLTPIIGSLDLLIRRSVGSAREQQLIEGALLSAQRAKSLVQRLLAFARRQPLELTAVDLSELVLEVRDLVSSSVGPQVELTLNVLNALPLARADASQVEMALLNLAMNARDAMPKGGKLVISASVENVVDGHEAGLMTGRYVCLSVTDNGIGMDEETITRAVEPFFSTKGVGEGTGLGLSMAHGLATQLGGALLISSNLGVGTKIEMYLPVWQETLREPTATASLTALPRYAGKALLVDDERHVRAITADMLRDLGLEVLETASANEALQVLATDNVFDLLVTDHTMPGMTGTELARAARKACPELDVLIMSGYFESDAIAHEFKRIQKPFRQSDLAHSIGAA